MNISSLFANIETELETLVQNYVCSLSELVHQCTVAIQL